MSSFENNIKFKKTSFLSGINSEFINQLYSDYLSDPKSLPEGWKKFFAGDKFRSYLEFATLVATRKNSDFVDKWKRLICEWHLFRINFHTYCLEIVNQKSLEQSLLNCTKK